MRSKFSRRTAMGTIAGASLATAARAAQTAPRPVVLIGATAMTIGLYEFWLLARRQQIKADVTAGYLGAAALFTVFCFKAPGKPLDLELIQAIIIVFTIATLAAAMLRGAPFEKMITSAGVTGLTQNSVAPASRAACTRDLSECAVSMITGTKGAGLSGAVRSRRQNSVPSSRPMM